MLSPVIFNTDGAGRMLASSRIPLLTLAWRRNVLVLSVFVAAVGAVLLILLLMPRTYEGSMQFLLSNERIHSPVGPDKNTQAIVYLDEVGEARINTEVAILTSNDLLKRVVQQSNLVDTSRNKGLSDEAREEAALDRLKKDLSVTPLKKSAIIQVHYKSADPARAVNVLRNLSELYLDSHLKLRGDRGSSRFFEDLWRDYSIRRDAAEDALARFKAQYKIVSLADEKTLSLQHEADLERQYADVQSQTSRSNHQAGTLRALLSTTPSSIIGERKTAPNQAEIQQLSAVLLGLENKQVEAASRYLPNDRVLVDLHQQITQTQAALRDARAKDSEEVSTIANPVRSQTEGEFIHTQSELAGAQAMSATLSKQLLANHNRLAALDGQAAAYNLLNENVTRLNGLVHDYREKADAALVSQLLDEKHISDVSLVGSPFASSKPVSPHIPAILAAGLVWSLVLAGGCSYLLNRKSPYGLTPLAVERALGAPVLACVRLAVPASSDSDELLAPAGVSSGNAAGHSSWRAA